jgi:hypothetical protein
MADAARRGHLQVHLVGAIEEPADPRADLRMALGRQHRAGGGEPELMVERSIDRPFLAVHVEPMPEAALGVEAVLKEHACPERLQLVALQH